MRYQRATEKLRLLAEGCEEIGSWPPWDEPYLVEMYAFGPVLEGADPLDVVQVVHGSYWDGDWRTWRM